jgi:MarR family transcriptional regulator, lower aerobic nicotinate degradation pathway regulator
LGDQVLGAPGVVARGLGDERLAALRRAAGRGGGRVGGKERRGLVPAVLVEEAAEAADELGELETVLKGHRNDSIHIVGDTNVGKANGIRESLVLSTVFGRLAAVYDAPQRLRRLPSWLLNQAALQANRYVSEGFAAEGVRRHHFTVLVALDDGGPASQADLGRRLAIDRSDMAAVVNDLESAGFVARARDAQDRRRNVVALTAEGRQALQRLDARAQAAQDELVAPLSAAERRELERLLTKLVDHGVSRQHER